MEKNPTELISNLIDPEIKRGIDLSNRLWSDDKKKEAKSFSLFRTEGRNKITYFFVALIFLLNLGLTYPLFSQDLSSYYSSFILMAFGNFFSALHLIDKSQFFILLTFISVSFAPVSVYFFVRNNVRGDEFVAFLATLFFILPNPFLGKELTIVNSILKGDSSHSLIFPLIPFFLLYFQDFLSTGLFKFAAISSLGGALIAIISPFGFFNYLIMLLILGISDGFIGNLRTKLSRLLLVIILSFGLSFFWYYPTIIQKILKLSYIQLTVQKLISNLPIFLPLIPILGILLFLVFDRRSKWQSFFIGITMFLVYLVFYMISIGTQVEGMFTSTRYALELSFSASFLLSLIIILSIDYFFRKIFAKLKQDLKTILYGIIFLFLAVTLLLFGVILNPTIRQIKYTKLTQNKNMGTGTIIRQFKLDDLSFDVAAFVSLITLIFIITLSFKKSQNIKTS